MLKDFRKGKKKQGILNFEEWNRAPIKKKKKKKRKMWRRKKKYNYNTETKCNFSMSVFPFFSLYVGFSPSKIHWLYNFMP